VREKVLPEVLTRVLYTPVFPDLVIFTNARKAQFTRGKIQNYSHSATAGDENLHAVLPSHHQQRFSTKIAAGICHDAFVVPHEHLNSLTGRNYKAFFESSRPDFLANVPLVIRRELHFIHGGAIAHFSLVARRHLNRKFPSWSMDKYRWINWLVCTLTRFKCAGFLHVGPFEHVGVFISIGGSGNTPKSNCGRYSGNLQHARDLGSS
jgi:hypothetical protein